MKHASEKSLEKITDLLVAIRNVSGLQEKKTGIFYRKGKAYLHFHESADGELYADIRLSNDSDFMRYNISATTSWKKFLEMIEKDLRTG